LLFLQANYCALIMKTVFQIILSLFVSANVFASSNTENTFTINGTITGIADGASVVIQDANNNNEEFATGKIIGGKFTLKGKVPEPTLCYLKVEGDVPQYIYIENKLITIKGSKPLAKNLVVTGSSSNNDFMEFQKVFNPLFMRLQSQQFDRSLIDTIQMRLDEFVNKYPSSYVTPFMLFATATVYDDPVLLENRLNKLSEPIRNSLIGVGLNQYIATQKIGAIGTMAVDFTQPDTSGTPIALSSFKGKYVLVDFWASWCGPCRMENPNVVANYQKFKNKNFTVLGVSLDRPGKKDDWINAIKKDNLSWTQVSDLQFWNNSAAQLYRVTGIPFNFLIDPAGKIVGRNLRGQGLEEKLCEVIGCN